MDTQTGISGWLAQPLNPAMSAGQLVMLIGLVIIAVILWERLIFLFSGRA